MRAADTDLGLRWPAGRHDEIDSWINPQRYAVSASPALLPPVVYLAQAQEAVVGDPAKPRATQGTGW